MKVQKDSNIIFIKARLKMKHSYEEFLNSTIKSEDGSVSATFKEKDNHVYIVTPEFELLFKMLYKPELHDYLLIAAQQLLDVKLEKDRIKKNAQCLADNLVQEYDEK